MEFDKIDFLQVPIMCNYILNRKAIQFNLFFFFFVCVQNLVVLSTYITEICCLPVQYFYVFRKLNIVSSLSKIFFKPI